MKVNESDKKELIGIGILVDIPDIPRAWIVTIRSNGKYNFDKDKFNLIFIDQSTWHKKNFDLFRYNGYDWPQKVAIYTLLDDFIVLAISTDFVAGQDSDGFMGYFVLTKKEYEDVKVQLLKLIKDKTNGLHHYLFDIIKQGYSGDKAYLNFFDSVRTIDAQDDGVMRFITPKRRLPPEIRAALKEKLSYINWDESEYKCDAFTGDEYSGIMEIILLQDVFQENNVKERLAEINTLIDGVSKKEVA
jgi:hypothetical protein